MMPAAEGIDTAKLTSLLEEQAAMALEGKSVVGSVEPIGELSPVADATIKLRVRDREGRPVAVVLCSSAGAPEMTARAMERARAARVALGEELGRVILEPLRTGDVEGLSYTVLPFCPPLIDHKLLWRLQRRSLRPALLEWLRDASKATRVEPAPSELDAAFRAPLEHLAQLGAMPDRVRAVATRALERLDSGQWSPAHVLMHGDLWKDNVLLDPTSTERGFRRWRHFILIDWPGGLVRGYGLYDLVRLSNSIGVQGRALQSELDAHCRILGCDPSDGRSHLAAALGQLGLHLEHFPMEDYVRTADACLAKVEHVGR